MFTCLGNMPGSILPIKGKFPVFRFAAYCNMKRGLSLGKTWPFERQYTVF